MAVLAATFTTSIVFFPVTFFSGVSKYIFTPLALGVVLSIFASYFFRDDGGAALLVQNSSACTRKLNTSSQPGEIYSNASKPSSTRSFKPC